MSYIAMDLSVPDAANERILEKNPASVISGINNRRFFMFYFKGSALLIVLAACMASSCTTRAADVPTTRPAVVVELFTSEGCSSCPPAEAVLADLAKADAVDGVQVIPLAMHVDYFNDLGWADPFSSPQFSDRQKQYASIFNSDQIYTPQMIVDGTDQFVGSDGQKATAAIANAAAQAKGNITIDLDQGSSNGNSVKVKISVDGIHRAGNSAADVLLAITEADLSTDVPRGENAGQTLRHTGVVRMLRRVATINPTDALPFSASNTVELLSTWQVNRLHIAVFVQDPQTGKILAAAYERVPGAVHHD